MTTPALSSRHRPGRIFLSLRQRNFRLYWIGQLVSVLGTSMQAIGQAWLVLQMTHSAWLLGVVGALQFVPVLLFSVHAGVLADRWNKRRVLLVTQSLAMGQALLLWLLVLTQTVQLWHIYVLAVALGLTRCLDTPTRQAFVVEMVGRDDLPNAIALNSSLNNLARVVGPGIGGVLIALSGVGPLFLLNAVSFLAVLVALLLMNRQELYPVAPAPGAIGDGRRSDSQLRELMTYFQTVPAILLAIVIVGLVLLFGSNFNVILPLIATTVLHVGAEGFGFLSAALGAGTLLSALWLAWANLKPTTARVLLVALLFALVELAFASAHALLLNVVLVTCVGFAENTLVALGLTAVQLDAPDHLQGRIMGVFILFIDGSVPAGYLLMGWLASVYSAPIALALGATGALLVTGCGVAWHLALRRRAASAVTTAPLS